MLRTSECKYRCLYKSDELNFKTSKWTEMKKNEIYRENCDFIETHCRKENKTTFRYIHVQVIKSTEKHFQKEDELHPSVFLLLFDSTSVSSAIRSIVETNEVLRRHYDATTFYYHNKVGINSRPNAYAIFSGLFANYVLSNFEGTRISELDKHLFPDKFQSEYPDSCKKGVRVNETITYDFVKQNYASIIVEDWIGAFNWPNCIGYSDPPTDHYGRLEQYLPGSNCLKLAER
uniref:Uncharacterized protein n=1 Tax=Setaria digitata TaxID=48799 RepID=A0A915PJ05_9BILA